MRHRLGNACWAVILEVLAWPLVCLHACHHWPPVAQVRVAVWVADSSNVYEAFGSSNRSTTITLRFLRDPLATVECVLETNDTTEGHYPKSVTFNYGQIVDQEMGTERTADTVEAWPNRHYQTTSFKAVSVIDFVDDGNVTFEIVIKSCESQDRRFNIAPSEMPTSMSVAIVNWDVPSPLITLLTPTTVSADPSARVTIQGRNFMKGCPVLINGVDVSSWPQLRRRQMNATSPSDQAANATGAGKYSFLWEGPERMSFKFPQRCADSMSRRSINTRY